MALRYTPLDNIPYPDGQEKPNVPLIVQRALLETERHTIIPVTDATDRGSRVTTPFVGMVSYNAATDSFEYYDGTTWKLINQVSGLPPWVQVNATPAINLLPGKYYDLTVTINVKYAMSILAMQQANVIASVYTNMFNNFNMALQWDGGGWSRGALTSFTYQQANGSEYTPQFHATIATLTPGTHKIVGRVTNSTQSNTTAVLGLNWTQIILIGLAQRSGGF
jgi:hypothetical protein